MGQEMIRLEGIGKTYALYQKPWQRLAHALGIAAPAKRHEALRSISLDIGRGECVGIIGVNGSGKSTLLKIITGVLTPSCGKLEVHGRISALLELGAGFHMEYSGMENIFLNGAMLGFSREEIEERLEAVLAFADIGEYIYQPVKSYSSGMFVRLAFALAIHIDPEILIVDEALSVGDVFFQAKCFRKFEEFRARGKTIVFVSHDLSTIHRYCDRVFLLHKGALLGQGGPKEMIDAYKQLLVGLEGEKGGLPAQPWEEEALSYGNGRARISSVWSRDDQGRPMGALLKGVKASIGMRVEILEDIESPILAFTIKNAKGVEICGTNTLVEKYPIGSVRRGEILEAEFTQILPLQGGEYLVSFGVTGFEGEDFTVYHRLYDGLKITVVSDKDTVGYFDLQSRISVSRQQ